MKQNIKILGVVLISAMGCSKGAKTSTSSSSNASSSGNGIDLVCSQMAVTAASNPSFALLANNSSLSLLGNSPITDFEQAADDFVQEKLDSHLQATPVGLGIQVIGNTMIRDYQLSIDGTPLCSNGISVFSRPNQSQLLMRGRVPSIGGLSSSVFDNISNLVFPTEDYAVATVYAKLKLDGQVSSQKILKQCIIFENSDFSAATKVSFVVNRRPYSGLVTSSGIELTGKSHIRSAAPDFLEEAAATTKSATATVAVAGSSDSTSGTSDNVYQTKTVTLTSLSSGGSLCSQDFVSISLTGDPSNPTVNSAPLSSTGNFTYPQSNIQFFAATTFYNASTHVSWLLQNGFIPNWPGPQVEIVLNATDTNGDNKSNGVNDTAVYIPNGNTLTDPPQIELGNGDGTLLQNLWTDPDAVQHETGHHLVYTRLTDIGDSISVVIHEGYADSQVFLQNQSPCLCPTVCPPGSSVCLSEKCLRSAANNFTMAAPSCSGTTVAPPQCLPVEVHQRSQAISGMLWDVAQDIGPANGGYAAALMLEVGSITYLIADSEYGDMLEALIKADEDVSNKGGVSYQAILLQEMCARGFDNATNPNTGKSWMSQISVPYACGTGSGDIPLTIQVAPATSGAINVPTTANGGGG